MDRGELIIYRADDGGTDLQVRMAGETVWANLNELAELFGTTRQNLTMHIANIYQSAELEEVGTCKEFLQVQREGTRTVERAIKHYNLDLIIAVGYRVNSLVATRFRQWATAVLREYLIKGFAMNDERLKDPDHDYFEELLRRIRAIRASEKRFYRKVCDIFAESSDYDKDSPLAREFFQTVQNKLHWAAHGHTAAEVVRQRADATKPNMGLTYHPKPQIRKVDVTVGKNYLDEEENENLEGLVSQFFEFAEGQARRRKPVTMAGWIVKLNGLLTLNESEVLIGKGTVSAAQAREHAYGEYEKYRAGVEAPDAYDDLAAAAKAIKKLNDE